MKEPENPLTPEELFKVIDLWVKKNPKESNVLFKALEYKKDKILKNPCNHDKSEISNFVYNKLPDEKLLKIDQQIKTCASCENFYREIIIEKYKKNIISERTLLRKTQILFKKIVTEITVFICDFFYTLGLISLLGFKEYINPAIQILVSDNILKSNPETLAYDFDLYRVFLLYSLIILTFSRSVLRVKNRKLDELHNQYFIWVIFITFSSGIPQILKDYNPERDFNSLISLILIISTILVLIISGKSNFKFNDIKKFDYYISLVKERTLKSLIILISTITVRFILKLV